MNADKFVVRGQTYDVLSPATFGDYIETVGAACINPSGYPENKLFLAYDDNVQKLFRATAAIAYSELLIKNTNCEPTTMAEALANALSAGGVSYDNSDSGLTASNVQGAIDEVNGNVETVNSDLANLWDDMNTTGVVNFLPCTMSTVVDSGINYQVRPDGTVIADTSGRTGSSWKEYFKITTQDDFDRTFGAFKGKRCKLTGCPTISGAPDDNFFLLISTGDGNIAQDFGDGSDTTFTFPSAFNTSFTVYIRINKTVGTVTFKPMLSLASLNLSYSDYVPYAKTNRELTEISTPIIYKFETADADANVTYLKSQAIKMGDMVFLTGTWIGNNTSAESLLTLPNDLKPTGSTTVYGVGSGERSSGTVSGHYVIKNSGKVFQSLTTQAVNNGQFTFIYSISKS